MRVSRCTPKHDCNSRELSHNQFLGHTHVFLYNFYITSPSLFTLFPWKEIEKHWLEALHYAKQPIYLHTHLFNLQRLSILVLKAIPKIYITSKFTHEHFYIQVFYHRPLSTLWNSSTSSSCSYFFFSFFFHLFFSFSWICISLILVCHPDEGRKGFQSPGVKAGGIRIVDWQRVTRFRSSRSTKLSFMWWLYLYAWVNLFWISMHNNSCFILYTLFIQISF